MYVCIFIQAHKYMCMYIYVYIYLHTHAHTLSHTHPLSHTRIHTHTHTHTHKSTFIHAHDSIRTQPVCAGFTNVRVPPSKKKITNVKSRSCHMKTAEDTPNKLGGISATHCEVSLQHTTSYLCNALRMTESYETQSYDFVMIARE